MGHATAMGDSIESVGAYEKYVLPILVRDNPDLELSVAERAAKIAANLASDRNLDGLRKDMGDCALALCVVGIMQPEEAVRAAAQMHIDPTEQQRIATLGGLYVGAEAALVSLEQANRVGVGQ